VGTGYNERAPADIADAARSPARNAGMREALMIRRFVSTATFIASVGVSVLAGAERATFILTDGERKSGPIVFHTDSRENLINGNLNLGASDGKQQTFPVGQD